MNKTDGLKKRIDNILTMSMATADDIVEQTNSRNILSGKFWVTAVAIDICNYKNIIKRHDNMTVIKLLNVYYEIVLSLCEEPIYKEDIVKVDVQGDKILILFKSPKREQLSNAIEFSIHINTLLNHFISTYIQRTWNNNIQIKFGIGVWMSNDNSILTRNSGNYVFNSTIGSAVEHAFFLAKLANRTKDQVSYKEIMINNIGYANALEDTKVKLDSNFSKVAQKFGEEIWHGNPYIVELSGK